MCCSSLMIQRIMAFCGVMSHLAHRLNHPSDTLNPMKNSISELRGREKCFKKKCEYAQENESARSSTESFPWV